MLTARSYEYTDSTEYLTNVDKTDDKKWTSVKAFDNISTENSTWNDLIWHAGVAGLG